MFYQDVQFSSCSNLQCSLRNQPGALWQMGSHFALLITELIRLTKVALSATFDRGQQSKSLK